MAGRRPKTKSLGRSSGTGVGVGEDEGRSVQGTPSFCWRRRALAGERPDRRDAEGPGWGEALPAGAAWTSRYQAVITMLILTSGVWPEVCQP